MRLLDLFCGAGGCSVGYHWAGFTEIVGVDNRPQPRYPFAFVQADALDYLREHGHEFDAVHASPPCQRYSVASNINGKGDHPDLLPMTRDALKATGRPWVIENVPGSPMIDPILVCGLSLNLRVKRHRWFESNVPLIGTSCPPGHPGSWVTVFGGGAPAVPDNRRRASARVARKAMGIDWMTRDEISQAVPPAYTQYIGRQLIDLIRYRQSGVA